jgi:peptide/nickel transport system ATP-binding protein
VVEIVASRIAVMHLGKLVEVGETGQILREPSHSYTKHLLAAVPVPDPDEQQVRREERARLIASHETDSFADNL